MTAFEYHQGHANSASSAAAPAILGRRPEARSVSHRTALTAAAQKDTPYTPVISAYWMSSTVTAWVDPSSSQGNPSSPSDSRYSAPVQSSGAASHPAWGHAFTAADNPAPANP